MSTQNNFISSLCSFAFPILLFLLVISSTFDISYLQYLDDFCSVILFLVCLFSSLSNPKTQKIFSLIILFLPIGAIGNLISGYYLSLFNVLLDWFLCMKWPIACLGLYIISKKIALPTMNRILDMMFLTSYILMLVMIIYSVVTKGLQYVLGVKGYRGTVGIYCAIFSWFSALEAQRNAKIRISNILLMVLSMVLCLMSSSSFGLALCLSSYLFILFMILPTKHVNQYRGIIIMAGFLLLFALFRNKIVDYFLSENSPRYILFSKSFYLMKSFFPFGVGLGLYGGSVAAMNYSPIYILFDFEQYWNMGPGGLFLLDSFYPTIIGEFGFLGVLLYFLLFLCISKTLYRARSSHLLLLILLLSGVSSNFLNSNVGLCFAFILAENNLLCFSYRKADKHFTQYRNLFCFKSNR
jgi:hypothetical protein